MDIETENRIADLEAELKKVKQEWELARDNLLWAALIGPGQLVFGGNIMRLDKNGIQVKANDGNVSAMYFVDQLMPNVTNASTYGYILGRVDLNQTTDWDASQFQAGAFAQNHALNKSFGGYFSANTAAFDATDILSYGAYVNSFYSPGGISGYLYSQSTSTKASNGSVGSVFTITSATADNAPLWLQGADNDPDSLSDGMIWYRSDTDKFYWRRNGVTTEAGGSILTDTAWAAKGDLVAGTANDTAAIQSVGNNGYVLFADSTQTTGIRWGGVWNFTTQTTNYGAANGDFVLASNTITVTLPTVLQNYRIGVKNDGSGVVTVARGASDTIYFWSSVTSFTLNPGEAVELGSAGGSVWEVY